MTQVELVMGLADFTTAAFGILNVFTGAHPLVNGMVMGAGICTIVLHTYVLLSKDPDA